MVLWRPSRERWVLGGVKIKMIRWKAKAALDCNKVTLMSCPVKTHYNIYLLRLFTRLVHHWRSLQSFNLTGCKVYLTTMTSWMYSAFAVCLTLDFGSRWIEKSAHATRPGGPGPKTCLRLLERRPTVLLIIKVLRYCQQNANYFLNESKLFRFYDFYNLASLPFFHSK